MFAIHSVFILKENILFLEEWIDYHIQLGFNRFYLYDNSKVSNSCIWNTQHTHFKEGKINKYNVNYEELIKLSNNELYNKLYKIMNKYKCIKLIDWSPKDMFGKVYYKQREAHLDCLNKLKNDKIKWCANIDMDEYIVLKNHATIQDYINSLDSKVSNILLSQKRFDSRFNNIGKPVTSIVSMEKTQLELNHSNKCIYRVANTKSLNIHGWFGTGKQHAYNITDIWFNHYKLNSNDYVIEDNINKNIKRKINENYKTYIKII